ncbi:MAG TPA: HlyD family efflux transporter periplasmic adaptor subunit [Candidatus Eisenbacteria bacterium]|nr:HlyD family efflux transporter periplasmic adaptor subunit [Candidatus Eisenbacteria bacterium]
MRRTVPLLLLLVATACGRREAHYTGFVEGEERVIRSEVTGRVLEVRFAEGDTIPAGEVIARLDDQDIQAKLQSKERELAVVDADIKTAEERVELVRSTWERNLAASDADLRQATTTAEVADRTLRREAELVKTGASTVQLLDDARQKRDQAASGLERAREMRARTQAEERNITVTANELATLRERRTLTEAQLQELRVTAAKYEIRAPAVPTVVQTQHIWPGELAQPGAPIVAVLDPRDKYVQVYVPVAEVAAFTLGRRVEIELDSLPGHRVPGEVSFVADQANFTPEKIETRSDRMAQVYRAKIRVLEGVEKLQPGTEGNVYLP